MNNQSEAIAKLTNHIQVIMADEFTGEPVVRFIHTSNFTTPYNGDKNPFDLPVFQEKQLNNWIKERGNEQHNTILRLMGWDFIHPTTGQIVSYTL